MLVDCFYSSPIGALPIPDDFLHFDSINGNGPLDFNTTTPGLFLTRWITHFCAPVFVFLAGTSIFFVRQKQMGLTSNGRKI